MNAFLAGSGVELWNIAGWTMLHFMWLGTVVGAAALVCRMLLRRASANVRYVAAVCCLVVLAGLPCGIAGWLYRCSPPLNGGAGGGITGNLRPGAVANHQAAAADTKIIELHGRSTAVVDAATPNPTVESNAGAALLGIAPAAEPSPGPSLTGRRISFAALESCIPYLPWLWIIGTPITLVLLLTGVVGTRRLGQASRPIHDGPIAELLARLTASLHITRRVTVAVCERIAAPVLIGIVRPIILLPPAALTGWSPDELEMVLLHELAHVRRWDNLFNLMQRLVESLLFFHPAVWLISNWVRRERELCCDAAVVGRTNRPHAYAEMLVALAAQLSEPGRPRPRLTPAASSAMAAGPLRTRIRRILQLEDDPMLISGKSFAIMLSGFLVVATLGVLYLPTVGQAEQSATEATQSTKKSRDDTKPSEAGNTITADRLLIDAPAGDARVTIEGDRVELHTEPKLDVPPTTGQRNTEKSVTTVVAYDIPHDMIRDVSKWANLNKFKAQLDDKTGHFVLQAPADMQATFRKLLDATTKWRASYAVREQKIIEPFQEQGQPRLTWAAMGLTFGQEKSVESRRVQPSPIVGVEVVRVEPGSPGAWLSIEPKDIVANVSNFKATSLSELESIIKAVTDGSPRTMHTISIVKANGEFVQTYLPSKNPAANFAENPRASTSNPSREVPPPTKRGPFPSLEDQKLADLAWKRLNLELEPLNDADLNRVRALGYEGGVEVVGDSTRAQRPNEVMIQTGDILVGLHVWPTGNVKDVVEVLNRDDLAELNPLKFYVVRPVGGGGFGGGPAQDGVVTGRVTVMIGGGSGGGGGTFARSDPARTQSTPTRSTSAMGPYQAAPSTPTSNAAADDPFGSTDIKPRPLVAENDASAAVPRLTAPQAPAATPVQPAIPTPNALPVPYIPRAEIQQSAPLHRARALPQPVPTDSPPIFDLVTPVPTPTAPFPAPPSTEPSPDSAKAELSKSTLRYDGKSFEQWRGVWKTELSTAKRMDAVKALAAFGRAGYGKEATEVILDVAGEYDFYMIDSSAEGKLKETVLDELAPLDVRVPDYRPQSLAQYWVPDLAARLQQDPKKWKSLAEVLIYRVQTDDKVVQGILQSLASSSEASIRGGALTALIGSYQMQSGGPQLNDATRKLIDNALASKDPRVVGSTLWMFVYTPPSAGGGNPPSPKLLYRPLALASLLVHTEPDVRLPARRILPLINEKDAPDLVDLLLAVLKDPSREQDHIAAMQALAVMDSKAEKAGPALIDILKNTKNQDTFAAAVIALVHTAGQPSQLTAGGFTRFNLDAFNEIVKTLNDEDQRAVSKTLQGPGGDHVQKLIDRLTKDDDMLLPPKNPGGFGGGGGGGGGFF